MKPYLKKCKVLSIQSDIVVVEMEDKNTFTLEPRQLPKFVQVGDLLRFCEHGFYDVVDDEGNLIFRR